MQVDKPWEFKDSQVITINGKVYNAHAAISLATDLPVIDLPIDHIYMAYPCPCQNTLRDFIAHVRSVNEADLNYPIILNEDGCIIDGKHRLAKAIIEGHETIKAKRFVNDPAAIWDWE